MNKYFSHEKITERVTRIQGVGGVFMYLVEGDYKACLLDTGYGIGNVAEYVRMLTNKPCFVILTHGHEDHAGGASLFDEVYMNMLDKELYEACGAVDYRRRMINEQFPEWNIPDTDMNPKREAEFLQLNDGDEFDLGGIHLQAVWTPGHTKGMTMILIKEERIMLFGDGCGNKVLLFEDYSSKVSEYLKSLRKVKEIETQYDRVLRNHTNGESTKEILDQVIGCCEKIINRADAHMPTTFENIPLFSAKELNDEQFPKDGSEGNILYRIDKAC